MKYIKQLVIIVGISLVGELLKHLLPLPIPASIYGMVLLFVGLMTGVIKLESVKETGKFLIEIMPVMFIPAAVGLIEKFEELKAILVPLVVITVVSTFFVMTVTGKTTEFVLRHQKKEEK